MYIPGGEVEEPEPKSTSQRRGVRFGDEEEDHEVSNGFGMIPRAQ